MKAACKIAAFFINKYERLRQKSSQETPKTYPI